MIFIEFKKKIELVTVEAASDDPSKLGRHFA